MSEFLAWCSLLWMAGAVCFWLTIKDVYRRIGFGGKGDRRSRRHGRNQPGTDGSATGSFLRRFN